MGIEKLRSEFNRLHCSYVKKSAKFMKQPMVPPSVASSALKSITDKMDKVEEELKQLLLNCEGCALSPAGPYCIDCKWYSE